MTKYTFINKHGMIKEMSFKEIKEKTGKTITWADMNNIKADYFKKETKEFLDRYGLKHTIFNVANFQEWGHIQLYPHFQEVAIKNGARRVKQ